MPYLFILFLLAFFFIPQEGSAEPWLSNRFAQNCAACHAPGRVNRPAMKRRCTLSCQGCHVNPNGGGLRNYYGKYNQNKWLHSIDSSAWKQGGPPPAPYAKQAYNHKVVDEYLKKASPAAQRTLANKLYRQGATTRYLNAEEEIPHELYTKEHAAEEFTVEPSDARYIMRIPDDDPYRLRRSTVVTAGGDLRYFILSRDDQNGERQLYTFPMGVDFGLRYMPIDKISLVTEARFLNMTLGSAWDDVFRTGQVRSAYLMADDLLFNTYAMAGLYRPMFGHYSPDHTSLYSKMTGLNQYTVLNAVTLGTAPNVPFLNLHYFSPSSSAGSISAEQGFAANLGARFVTYGLSFMLSYWKSSNESGAVDTEKEMISINAGGAYGPLVANFDLTTIERELVGVSRDKGAVTTTELKYKLWREVYLQTNYAVSNTLPTMSEGNASQLSYGVKAFLLAGTELELLAGSQTKELPDGEKTHDDYYLMQFHLFF